MEEKEILASELLNALSYPTEKWLQFLENYNPSKSNISLAEFVEKYLPQGWALGGYTLKKKDNKWILKLHTYGWSGNEEIIRAILQNRILLLYMNYYKWKAGGHYTFVISKRFIEGSNNEKAQ